MNLSSSLWDQPSANNSGQLTENSKQNETGNKSNSNNTKTFEAPRILSTHTHAHMCAHTHMYVKCKEQSNAFAICINIVAIVARVHMPVPCSQYIGCLAGMPGFVSCHRFVTRTSCWRSSCVGSAEIDLVYFR